MSPELTALVERARQHRATPAERRAQRRDWIAAEMATGSDADEAEYREALAAGDRVKLARLDAEADARRAQALAMMGDDA
jgi:hypothetical protein